MKAKDGLGRILAGRAPTADEGTAIDRVMQTPTPNRRQDDGMIELTACDGPAAGRKLFGTGIEARAGLILGGDRTDRTSVASGQRVCALAG